jgi:hypothetical protein
MQDSAIQTEWTGRLVALLIVRDTAPEWPGALAPPAPIRIGSHLLIEHQARQAVLAKASEIIVLVESPDSGLLRGLDRVSRETGVPIHCVSDGLALARRLGSADHILLIAEAMVLPQAAINALGSATPPALLVTANSPASAHFERIDAQHVWAGAALLESRTIHATVDMLGEWDLILTLLRRAVQAGARRTELPADLLAAGRVLRIAEQADADRALAALYDGDALGSPDLLSAVLAPLRRMLVVALARYQLRSTHFGLAGGFCSLLALAIATVHWPIAAILLALLAETALALASANARLMLERRPSEWLGLLIKGASLAALAVIGGSLTSGAPLALAGVLLPLGWLALTTYADARGNAPSARERWMRVTSPMVLLLALGGSLFGMLEAAFLLIGLSAFGTVASRLLAVTVKRI